MHLVSDIDMMYDLSYGFETRIVDLQTGETPYYSKFWAEYIILFDPQPKTCGVRPVLSHDIVMIMFLPDLSM